MGLPPQSLGQWAHDHELTGITDHLVQTTARKAQLGGVVVELPRFGDVQRVQGGDEEAAPAAADQHDADADVQAIHIHREKASLANSSPHTISCENEITNPA